MNDQSLDFVRGSGNLFRDLNLPNPELEQLRAILAAQIIKVLDEAGMSVRTAQEITGTAAADFSRLRNAKLGRFTIDRLMSILRRLNQDIEISVNVTPRPQPQSSPFAAAISS